jgi:hypothetical protein
MMSSRAQVSVKQIVPDDTATVAQFERWASDAAAVAGRGATECANLAYAMKQLGVAHAVNYAIYSAQRLVGGIGTMGEHFNVMWLHWDATRNGIGPRAAFAVLSLQLQQWGRAIVNQPNTNMCKALKKIMTTSRAANVDCRRGTSAMHIASGHITLSLLQ